MQDLRGREVAVLAKEKKGQGSYTELLPHRLQERAFRSLLPQNNHRDRLCLNSMVCIDNSGAANAANYSTVKPRLLAVVPDDGKDLVRGQLLASLQKIQFDQKTESGDDTSRTFHQPARRADGPPGRQKVVVHEHTVALTRMVMA